jgi:hypothetical protein
MGNVRLVPIEQVQPGQRAAKDVTDGRGNLLTKAGTELTQGVIDRLKARNVTHVFIEDAAGGLSPEQIEAERQKIQAEMDHMFASVLDQPHMAALKNAATEFLLSRLQG